MPFSTSVRRLPGMLLLRTPGVLLVPAPVDSPVVDPAIGPLSTISYPCTEPRDTSVDTSWLSWEPASRSLLPAADRRRCASAVARAASATEESVFPFTSPPVICWRSTHPTSETTTADSSSVLSSTRAWMDRRHAVTARGPGPGPAGPPVAGLLAGLLAGLVSGPAIPRLRDPGLVADAT